MRGLTSNEIDGTPFGVFAVMVDGRWHSSVELKEKCGVNALARLHELKARPAYGQWSYERIAGRGIEATTPDVDPSLFYYRLPPAELQRRSDDVALLLARQKLSLDDSDDPFTTALKRSMTVAETVFVLALATNDAQMNNARVRQLWSMHRPKLIAKLASALSSTGDKIFRRPFDLFDDDGAIDPEVDAARALDREVADADEGDVILGTS